MNISWVLYILIMTICDTFIFGILYHIEYTRIMFILAIIDYYDYFNSIIETGGHTIKLSFT